MIVRNFLAMAHFFFSSRRRHTRWNCDWSSDVCSSDLRYQDALDLAAQTGGAPDINAVRTVERVKRGFGFNFEQEISSSVGLFGRASRADGQTETYAFTEIDRSLSGGVSVKGGAFGRAADSLGIA